MSILFYLLFLYCSLFDLFRFVPTHKERKTSVKRTSRTSVTVGLSGEDLVTKAEMLAKLHRDRTNAQAVDMTDKISASTAAIPLGLNLARSNPLRSSHLWSKKSFEMYKRMQEYIDDSRQVPLYETLVCYEKGDPMGVVDTFYLSKGKDCLEWVSNDWIYVKSRFEVSKTRYIQTEIEPLVMMLSSRAGLRQRADNLISGMLFIYKKWIVMLR